MGGWIEKTLDPQLKKVKAKDFCTLMHLHEAARPIKQVPEADDFPFCSSMTPTEVNIALGAFARLKKRFEVEPPDEDEQDGFEFVMAEMNDRLRGATRRRCGLVNFLY